MANVEVYEPIFFNDDKHIQNFIKYLFNITPKSYNHQTKNNLYFFGGNRFDETHRKDLYQLFSHKFKQLNYEILRTSLTYIDLFPDETIEDFIELEFENLQQELNQMYPASIELYVLHLNQDMPHFHRFYCL